MSSDSKIEWTDATWQVTSRLHRSPIEACIGEAIARGVAPAGCDTEYDWPLPNVWLGTSVEDRKHGLPRLAHLRETPAALRFLSIEPLLEELGTLDLRGIGWVIVGAESGQRARPMDEGWVRSIRDQCAAQRVPFFYKQRLVGGRKVSLPVLDGAQHTAWPGVTRG